MSTTNKSKQLTLEERIVIETGIKNGSTKAAIATTLGKDKSTIGKEIKEHRRVVYRMKLPCECSKYSTCRPGSDCPGPKSCPNYQPVLCKRRDRSPGACNGCPNWPKCRYDKIVYDANLANEEYRTSLVSSREGVDITNEEALKIAEIIKPLLEQGQSPYQIVKNHPELGICEKTLYNYVTGRVFALAGIADIDLRCKVSRRLPRKLIKQYKKREDRSYLVGRLYTDYLAYIEQNGTQNVVEMDTVYNEITGPFMQTFKFLDYGFFFSIYHTGKTAQDMLDGVNLLEEILGPDLFRKYVRVLLTDRGGEFYYADKMECNDGSIRTKVFYCDPMCSGQKGSLENKHRELRYICPKETNLTKLGLTSQAKMNLALSHINSAIQESLHDKSPWEMLHFFAPDLERKFLDFGLTKIEKDMVTLQPYLLK